MVNSFESSGLSYREEASGLNDGYELQMYYQNRDSKSIDKIKMCKLIPYILKCPNNPSWIVTVLLTIEQKMQSILEDVITITSQIYHHT